MILTAAERQLIRMIRAAADHDLTIRVREGRHTVRITAYDDGGPGAGIGYGESFDAARHNVTELRAQRAAATPASGSLRTPFSPPPVAS